MFKSGEKGSLGSSGRTTLISRETELIGDINFTGNLDIEGTVRGKITALPGKEAMVRIVDKGFVEGELRAPSVVINGVVIADVHASEHLSLGSRARVTGDLYYRAAEMAIGAKINGNFNYRGEKDGSKAADTEADAAQGGIKPKLIDTLSVVKAADRE
ncbi:MAG: polymer-forming cytoskeletal protein [Halieaceae bacterium]|nr:polymer-forming cytoskeletal protein [Halieaceae bacterium]